MTRLQLELARKAAQLGCTTKYPDTGVCEFWMDGTMLSVLFPENMYCPVLDGSESKRKSKAESKLAKAFDAAMEFYPLYENALSLSNDSMGYDCRALATGNGCSFIAMDAGVMEGFYFFTFFGPDMDHTAPTHKYRKAKHEFLQHSGLT